MMRLTEAQIDAANELVITKIQSARVFLVAVSQADKEIPFLKDGRALCHSGPPVAWEEMCGAMRAAICGAAVYEGWVGDLDQAAKMAASGGIKFDSAHAHHALGPMAGIISPSMPVFVLRNDTFGNTAVVTINEGLGKTLRFGANDQTVVDRLTWMERVLGPILAEALVKSGPIDMTGMLGRGIQRGDECHNRNKATTSLLIRELAPWMVRTSAPREDVADSLAFMHSNDHFFLNLSMGLNKATMEPVKDVPGSTIVTVMATNGHDFGLKVAGLGDRWLTAPVGYATGNYFKGYGAEDADYALGDSYISEAAGIGAFAMAAAPGIGQFIGISAEDCVEYTMQMYRITLAEHLKYLIPALNFRGSPLGIDIRKVLITGVLPIINTGIAHKQPGIGQIGAGTVRPPMALFTQAAELMGLELPAGVGTWA
jgi:hypothetical protein